MDIHELRSEEQDAWLGMREALWPDFTREAMTDVEYAIVSDRLRTGVFIATNEEGRAIGFAEASLREFSEGCSSSPVGYLEAWYVAPQQRRRGIGRALVKAAERWAFERGCREMASDADLFNEISLHAHQLLGFDEVGRSVLFRKSLRSD